MSEKKTTLKKMFKKVALEYAGSGEIKKLARLRKRIDFNTYKDQEDNETPLSIAAREGNYYTVLYLLQHGADPNQTSLYISSYAIAEAAMRGYDKIIELLLKFGANINVIACNNTPLILAAIENHFETVKLLVKHGADIEKKGEYNMSIFDLIEGYAEIDETSQEEKNKIVDFLQEELKKQGK